MDRDPSLWDFRPLFMMEIYSLTTLPASCMPACLPLFKKASAKHKNNITIASMIQACWSVVSLWDGWWDPVFSLSVDGQVG